MQTDSLRIVHLSTYDIAGGAARAAYKLHNGLLQLGCNSLMMVADRTSDDPTVITFAPTMDLTSRLRRRLRAEMLTRSFSRYLASRPEGYERFSDDRSLYGVALVRQLPPCDVVNLHWIAGFVDYQAFFSTVPEHVPIFWRLSDMNALTGGCHFDHGCGRHTAGCGACPQLGSTDARDLSHQIWHRKQAVFSRLEPERLHIIALNRWMAKTVTQSPLLGKFPVTIVPNGIDTDVFAPRDTRLARHVLGIPQDRQVVLFAADVVANRRKGFALLAQALNELHDFQRLFLVSVGADTPRVQTDSPQLHLGHVDNDRLLSLIYSAADIYMIPSLQDNQPNTALEAMACGTPVIGFDVGGIPDMIKPGITGLLVPAEDVMGLSAAITELLRCPERRAAMAADCRRIAVDEYAREIQVRRYLELYRTAAKATNRFPLPATDLERSVQALSSWPNSNDLTCRKDI
jgi:glycosyltransferase involved in cell wall biosynthesis